MLLAVHVVCYSDLNWIQWFRMQFKHMLKTCQNDGGFIIILSMTEEEMIREIAEPILEQLKKIEKQLGNHRMSQLPQIKFVKEGNMNDGPFMIGDIEVTDELFRKSRGLCSGRNRNDASTDCFTLRSYKNVASFFKKCLHFILR